MKQGFVTLEESKPLPVTPPATVPDLEPAADLENMTKIELLQFADSKGIKVNQYASKKDVLAEIRTAQG